MGLVERRDGEYALTDAGHGFVTNAVADWAGADWTPQADDHTRAGTYETTVQARAVDPEFRATVLARYDRTCPMSGVDHPGLLDVAHVLSWSDLLQRTILNRAGERVSLPAESVHPEYLSQHNAALEWV